MVSVEEARKKYLWALHHEKKIPHNSPRTRRRMPAFQEIESYMETRTTPDENQAGGVRIRPYKPRDHKTVCELFVQGMLEYCPQNANKILRDYIDESLGMDLADIEATYFNAGGHFWVAIMKESEHDHETIVGAIGIDAQGDGRGEVRRLTVSKAHRRRGIARKLVAHLENWAREHAFKAIFLNCGDEMKQALRFYNALGFERTHEEVLCEDPYQLLVFFEKNFIA